MSVDFEDIQSLKSPIIDIKRSAEIPELLLINILLSGPPGHMSCGASLHGKSQLYVRLKLRDLSLIHVGL